MYVPRYALPRGPGRRTIFVPESHQEVSENQPILYLISAGQGFRITRCMGRGAREELQICKVNQYSRDMVRVSRQKQHSCGENTKTKYSFSTSQSFLVHTRRFGRKEEPSSSHPTQSHGEDRERADEFDQKGEIRCRSSNSARCGVCDRSGPPVSVMREAMEPYGGYWRWRIMVFMCHLKKKTTDLAAGREHCGVTKA